MEARRAHLPMNLQFFAESGSEGNGAGGEGNNNQGTGNQTGGQAGAQGGSQPPAIDYERIQTMLTGTLAAKEDTALKAYFKQQGLSQQEAEQAMAAFKAQKAANTPDVSAIQAQLSTALAAAQRANVEKESMLMATDLGISLKAMPYVLKLADLSKVTDATGAINKDALKESINAVLTDLPQLKETTANSTGFRQIGAASGGAANQAVDDQLDRIFGVKKKN